MFLDVGDVFGCFLNFTESFPGPALLRQVVFSKKKVGTPDPRRKKRADIQMLFIIQSVSLSPPYLSQPGTLISLDFKENSYIAHYIDVYWYTILDSISIRPKKNICVFRVTRPCLNFLFKFRRP